MKKVRIDQLAELVDGEIIGDGSLEIQRLESIEAAQEGDITFLVKPKSIDLLEQTNATAAIVPLEIKKSGKPIIRVRNPYLASAIIHNYLLEKPFVSQGIHSTVIVGSECKISEEISIGPYVVIGNCVNLGKRVTIGPGVYIGDNVTIGDDTEIKANVTIEYESTIGNRVTIHPGTVIGSDGYGYAPDEKGCHIKRPQVGTVRIDDDVEIGANCCVDRATFGLTWIKSGTKIDNLVQIAHNVVVGENCLMVSQSAASGSTIFGRNVVMGGQAATKGHVSLGVGVMVAARGGVTRDLPAGGLFGGYPAIPIKQWTKAATAFSKVPELRKEVRKLRNEIEELHKKIMLDD